MRQQSGQELWGSQAECSAGRKPEQKGRGGDEVGRRAQSAHFKGIPHGEDSVRRGDDTRKPEPVRSYCHGSVSRMMKWNPTHMAPKPQNADKARISKLPEDFKRQSVIYKVSQYSNTRGDNGISRWTENTASTCYCTASNTVLSRMKSKIILPKDK